MNEKNVRKVPALFGPETRFEVRMAPAVPFRVTLETKLDLLKTRLLREFIDEATTPDANAYLRRAANEAAALAWATRYPLLLFPELFEEKAHLALLQVEKQIDVRRRSLDLLTV